MASSKRIVVILCSGDSGGGGAGAYQRHEVGRVTGPKGVGSGGPEKRYWRLRRLESAVPAQLALKNVTLRKGRDTLCKVRQSGTCCAEREQPICTASRWQLMESLSGTAVSSTVAIVGSIWPKGPAQAGPAIQAQWLERNKNTTFEVLRVAGDEVAPKKGRDNLEFADVKKTIIMMVKYSLRP